MYVNLITSPDNHYHLYVINKNLLDIDYSFMPLKDNNNKWIIISYPFKETDIAEKFLQRATPYIQCGSINSEKVNRVHIESNIEKPFFKDLRAFLPPNEK